MKPIDINEYLRMNSIQRTLYHAKRKADETLDWIVKNPEKAAIAVSAVSLVIGGAKNVARFANQQHRLNTEKALKELNIYDRSLGCYHQLTRPLRAAEKVQIQKRRDHGEKMVNILNNMNVLRK